MARKENVDLLYRILAVGPVEERLKDGSKIKQVKVELKLEHERSDKQIPPALLTSKPPAFMEVTHCEPPAEGDLCVAEWTEQRGEYLSGELQCVWEKGAPDTRFIHPYNFVRIPSKDFTLSELAETSLFHRSPIAPHDHYAADRHSGYIDCRLTTQSQWFIPDARKRHTDTDAGHDTLGYFTLGKVEQWDRSAPENDFTEPAIPGASLRGMIRSVFEAATLSCFSVFDPSRLDFRGRNSLDQPFRGEDPQVRFVPVRVATKHDDGRLTVQVLDGTRSGHEQMSPAVMRSAFITAYVDDKTKKHVWNQLHATRDCSTGTRIIGVTRKEPSDHKDRRKQNINYRYYHVECAFAAEDSVRDHLAHIQAVLGSDNQRFVFFGYLHRTGKNIRNKHDERIFFDGKAPFNQLDGATFSPEAAEQAYQEFRDAETPDGTEPQVIVQNDVVTKTTESLKGYAERTKESPSGERPSHFVGKTSIERGDLFYALIDDLDGGNVKGLYPVAMPRLSHENTRGELLPRFFRPCSRGTDDPQHDHLCPACRVFGWTRELESGRASPDARRVDAWAGHVRFTNGVYLDDWNPTGEHGSELIPLAILAKPNPTTTMFYLRTGNFDEAKKLRRPPSNRNINSPMYRVSEAWLRGRKFYRHRKKLNPQSTNFAEGGLAQTAHSRSNQNQTVHLMQPGMRFGFRVYFDNLTKEELGSLLFALSLRLPKNGGWHEPVGRGENNELWHSLGRGKPLGMGACQIEIIKIQSWGGTKEKPPASRYQTLDLSVFDEMPSIKRTAQAEACDPSTWDGELDAFGAAWQTIASEAADIRDELIEMLAAEPPDGPIHYPTRPLSPHFANQVVAPVNNYAWFMDAKKQTNAPILPAAQAELPVKKTTGLRYDAKADE